MVPGAYAGAGSDGVRRFPASVFLLLLPLVLSSGGIGGSEGTSVGASAGVSGGGTGEG